MNGTHQLLTYAVDVSSIGDYIGTIDRNADMLINACMDFSLAVNIEKTKSMVVGQHRRMTVNEDLSVSLSLSLSGFIVLGGPQNTRTLFAHSYLSYTFLL